MATLEQFAPGTAAVVDVWGPDWVPLLAGPDRDRVRTVLSRHQPPKQEAPWLTSWFIGAGSEGLHGLDRHGTAFMNALLAVRPPVQDALVLNTLLDRGWPVEELYRLVVRHGLPYATWEQVAAWVSEGAAEDDILLRLWDRRMRAVVRTSSTMDH